MGVLFFVQDDGIINYQLASTGGTAIAGGQSQISERHYNNTTEYTVIINTTITVEYRHEPSSNRDSEHRR